MDKIYIQKSPVLLRGFYILVQVLII